MRFSRLIRSFPGALVLACAAMGMPTAAYAAASHSSAPGTIRVSTVEGKTRVSVHIPGVLDRVVWSKDQVYATALADLDNDGDVDLVASTSRYALVVWRNTDHGFVRVHARAGGPQTYHEPGMRSTAAATAVPQINEDHRGPADLAPDPGLVAPLAIARAGRPADEHTSAAPASFHSGRAPPVS